MNNVLQQCLNNYKKYYTCDINYLYEIVYVSKKPGNCKSKTAEKH